MDYREHSFLPNVAQIPILQLREASLEHYCSKPEHGSHGVTNDDRSTPVATVSLTAASPT